MNLSPKLLDVAHKRLFTKPSDFVSPICRGRSGRGLLSEKLRCLKSEPPTDFFSHLTCSIRKDREQGFIFCPSGPLRRSKSSGPFLKIAHKTCSLVMVEIMQTEASSNKNRRSGRNQRIKVILDLTDRRFFAIRPRQNSESHTLWF
jgi:hypothetical protein